MAWTVHVVVVVTEVVDGALVVEVETVSTPEVVVVLAVAVDVDVDAVEVTVLFEVVVAVDVEFGSVTVLSGLVVTLVIVTVVVAPLTLTVFVVVFVLVFVLVTLHLRVKWLRVPLTLKGRHFAGTALDPSPADSATPTGTSITTARTRTPSERMTERRFMASPSCSCR